MVTVVRSNRILEPHLFWIKQGSDRAPESDLDSAICESFVKGRTAGPSNAPLGDLRGLDCLLFCECVIAAVTLLRCDGLFCQVSSAALQYLQPSGQPVSLAYEGLIADRD